MPHQKRALNPAGARTCQQRRYHKLIEKSWFHDRPKGFDKQVIVPTNGMQRLNSAPQNKSQITIREIDSKEAEIQNEPK